MCSSLVIAACTALPASGPYSTNVLSDAKVHISGKSKFPDAQPHHQKIQYALVEVNEHTINTIAKYRKPYRPEHKWPKNTGPHVTKVEVGDIIQVTIFEQNSGGLFVQEGAAIRPGNFIDLPPQTVDGAGYINVPYAGLIKAAGLTANEISNSIVNALSDLALAPQVVVSFDTRGGSEVSVLGDVEDADRFSLGFNQDRILDVIASAGGPNSPGYETWVSLQRGDDEYTILMDELLTNPKKNIYAQPNDTVYLYREPEVFNVYGAAQFQGSLSFDKRKLKLSEALARANGLRDTQADPAEIYIYKEEPIEYVRQLEDAVSLEYANLETEFVPVIYRLNLREHKGFFHAQKFPVQDQDTVYIANAESVEYIKFLDIISTTSATRTTTERAF